MADTTSQPDATLQVTAGGIQEPIIPHQTVTALKHRPRYVADSDLRLSLTQSHITLSCNLALRCKMSSSTDKRKVQVMTCGCLR